MNRKRNKKSTKDSQVALTLFLVLIALMLFYLSGVYAASDSVNKKQGCQSGVELPYFSEKTFIVANHDARYTFQYDTMYRQAAWVAYILTRNDISSNNAERQNKFIPDPVVKHRRWPTAMSSHYTKTGYDRGHLLPSADRCGCQAENNATFHLSNISPQKPALNRRVWRNLEEQTRRWADRHDSLYVVTGGVLEYGLERLKGGVGVPKFFFKAIMVKYNSNYFAAAFLLPNSDDVCGSFFDYMVSVDDIEKATGFDLYHLLPDSIEDSIEAATDKIFWRK